MQQRVDRLAYRHFDRQLRGQPSDRSSSCHPFDNRAAPLKDCTKVSSATQRQPKGIIARLGCAASQYEVAETRETPESLGTGTLDYSQADYLGEAPRD